MTAIRKLSNVRARQAIHSGWLTLKFRHPKGQMSRRVRSKELVNFVWRRSLGDASPNAFLGAVAAELRKK